MSLPSVEILATEELPVQAIVFDDGGFGSQRQKQREAYAGRFLGVNYDNPALAALAKVLGLQAQTVQDPTTIGEACRRITDEPGPSLTVVPRKRDVLQKWYEGVSEPP